MINDKQRSFVYSPFITLETLSLAVHYGKKVKEQFYRQYINQCVLVSDNLSAIIQEAQRQAEKYGIASIDACHIAAAVVVSADEFCTFEKPTKPMFRTQEIKVVSLS
jgi:hypothetical protein